MTSPEPQPQQSTARPQRAWLVPAAAGLVVGLIVGAGATAALVGTPDKQQTVSAAVVPAVTTPVATTPAPAPTTAAPSPTGSSMNPLGAEVAKSAVKVAAFAYKQPVAQGAPRPEQSGYEWAAADVQVCATVDDVVVNTIPWHLVYADHTTISSSSTGYRQFPEPSYPWGDKDLPNGRCVRGWITFPVPVGKRPVSIEHNPQGSLTEWAIS